MECRSEGNLIHALNHSNPSQMLIEALSTDPRIDQKEEDFFLGHLCPGPSDGLKVRPRGGLSHTSNNAVAKGPRLKWAYRILSGGPSRGTIALEADNAPSDGETVQVSALP
jgi:hypothetical protein